MNQISVQSYFNEDGQLLQLPGRRQKKKLDIIIGILANKFQRGVNYSEKEVNEILNKYHLFNDPATLRRLLVGTSNLDRTKDGKRYWLV